MNRIITLVVSLVLSTTLIAQQKAPTFFDASLDSNGKIQLDWSASAAPVTGYKIYRNGVAIATINNASTVTFVDNNPIVGQLLTYCITTLQGNTEAIFKNCLQDSSYLYNGLAASDSSSDAFIDISWSANASSLRPAIANGNDIYLEVKDLTNNEDIYTQIITQVPDDTAASISLHVSGGNYLLLDQNYSGSNRTAAYLQQFGHAIAIDGDYAVIGAPKVNQGSGAAYIYQNTVNGWARVADLVPANLPSNANLGYAVDIDSNYVIVSAPGGDGIAYVFERVGSTWIERAALQEDILESNDEFGYAVAISQGVAWVGAPKKFGAGVVYFYNRSGNNWTYSRRQFSRKPLQNQRFGAAIDYDNNFLVIGSPGDQSNRGAAYIYESFGGNWVYRSRIQPNTVSVGDRYGTAVGIQGNKLAIGGPGVNNDAGDVVFYIKNGFNIWLIEGGLSPNDIAPGDEFGTSLDYVGNRLLATSPSKAADSGAVYVFLENTITEGWIQEAKLTRAVGPLSDGFGQVAALGTDVVFVGAPYENADQGKVYQYNFTASTWSFTNTFSSVIAGSLTFEVWVKHYGPLNDTVFTPLLADENVSFNITAPGDNRVNFLAGSSPEFFNYQLPTDRWTHLAFVADSIADNTKLYVNGVLTDEIDYVCIFGVEQFGASTVGGTTYELNGEFRDIRYWQGVRSAAEILQHFNTTLTTYPASLSGYWKVNEGTGGTISESTGNYPQPAIYQPNSSAATWKIDSIASTIVGFVPHAVGPEKSVNYALNTYEIGFGWPLTPTLTETGSTLPLQYSTITVDSSRPDSIKLAWSQNSDALSYYRITRDGESIALVDSTVQSWADAFVYGDSNSLANGQPYRYCLVPFSTWFTDPSGVGLVYDSICVTGNTLPINFLASDNTATGQVSLSWNNMQAFGDRIEISRDRVFFAQLDSSITAYNDDNPIPGRRHGYEWRLYNDGQIVLAANDSGSVDGVGMVAGYVVAKDGLFAIQGDTIRATSILLGDTIVREAVAGLVGDFYIDEIFYNTAANYTITLHPTNNASAAPIILQFNPDNNQFSPVLVESTFPVDTQGNQALTLSNFIVSQPAGEDMAVLSWDYTSSDTTFFQVFRDGQLLAILTDTNTIQLTTYSDTRAIPGSTAVYDLVAYVYDNDTLVTAAYASTTYSVPALLPVDTLMAVVDPIAGNVTLNWMHSSTTISGFYLFRDGTLIHSGTLNEAYTFVDNTGVPGTDYTYSITAYDERGGNTYESAPVFTDPLTTTYPNFTVPQNVVATAVTQADKVTVTFSYPSNGNQNFYGFRITREANGHIDSLVELHKDFIESIAGGLFEYSFTDYSGVPGQAYTYHVALIKRNPHHTGPVGSDNATFPAVTPPANFAAVASSIPGAIDLSWEMASANIDGFLLMRGNDTVAVLPDYIRAYTEGFGNSSLGVTRHYSLTSVRNVKQMTYPSAASNASAAPSTLIASALQVPQQFVASDVYPSHVQLSWTYPSYVFSRFFVYRDGILIDSLANNVRYYYDTSAVEGQTYLYQLEARYQGLTSNRATDAGSLRSLMQIEGVTYTESGFGIPKVDIVVMKDGQMMQQTKTDATGFYRINPTQKVSGDSLFIMAKGPNAHFKMPTQLIPMEAEKDRYVVNFIDTFYQNTIPVEEEVAEITAFMASIDPLTNKVELRWNTTSTNYTGFRLYRGLGQIADINGLAPKNYLDLIAAPGFGYVYTIEAYWELPAGTQVSAEDTAVIQVPQLSPVEALQAIPDSDEDVVKLFWSHPTDQHTYYEIKRNGVVIAAVPTGSRLTFVDSTGLPTYNYTYVVTAVEVGASGFYTSPARIANTRFPEVAPVTDLLLTAIPSENRVDVSWRHTSRYYDNAIIYRESTPIDTVARGEVVKISQDYWGRPNEVNHYAVMVEVEKDGLIYESDTTWIDITYPRVFPPSVIDTSYGVDALTVDGLYTAPDGYSGFQFYRDSLLLDQRTGKTTNFSFTDSDAQPNGTFTYKVRAFKTIGNTYFSTYDSIVLTFPSLTTPTNLQASDGAFFNNILITWDYASGANTGFELYKINRPGDTVLLSTLSGGLRMYNDIVNNYSKQGDPDPKYFIRAIKHFGGTLYRSAKSNTDSGYAEVQRFSEITSLTGTTVNGQLGAKVDIDDEYAVAANKANAVQVFSRGGVGNFQPGQVLEPEVNTSIDPDFGSAVHLTESRLFVSAPRNFIPPPQAVANGILYASITGDLNSNTEKMSFYLDGTFLGEINPIENFTNCLSASASFTVPMSLINSNRSDGFVIRVVKSSEVSSTLCSGSTVYFRFQYDGLNYLGQSVVYNRVQSRVRLNSINNDFTLQSDEFEIGEIYVYNKNNGAMDSSTIIRPYSISYVKANIFNNPDTTYTLTQTDTTTPNPIIKKGKSETFNVALTETNLGSDITLDTVVLRIVKDTVDYIYLQNVNLVGVNPLSVNDTMRWQLYNNTIPTNGSTRFCVEDQSRIEVKFVASSPTGLLANDCPNFSGSQVYQAVDFSTANNSGLDPNGNYWIEYTVYVNDQSDSTTDTYRPTISIEEVALTFRPLLVTAKTTFLPGSRLGIDLAGDDNIVYASSPYINGKGGAGVFALSGNDYAVTPSIIDIPGYRNVELGWTVAFVGDKPVLSAPRFPSNNVGRAVDFTRNANDQFEVNKAIIRSQSGGSDLFGQLSMDAYENLVIIGCPTDDFDNNASVFDVGSAYVFSQQKNGDYTELAKLKRPDAPIKYDSVGASVAIFGTQIAVGAPGVDLTGNRTNAGVVYLFETDADGDWIYKSTIQAPDAEAGARFGSSVSLNDNTLMVGAPGHGPNSEGKVYFIYVRDEIQSVIASDGTEGNKVRISWEYDGVKENISRFNVYRDTSLIAQVDPNKDFVFDTDGIPGKEYVYSVTSVTLNDVESLPKADEGWAEPDGIVDGRVVTYVGSNGVPNVNIQAWTTVDGEIYRYATTTGANGAYKIKKVYYSDSSQIYVRAFLEGHEFKKDTLDKEINLIQNQVAMDLFYDLTAYTVEGKVVYNNSACPIDSVDIFQHIIRTDGTRQLESTKTDGEGKYSFLIQPFNEDISYYEYTIDSTRIKLTDNADTTLFSFNPDTIRLGNLDTITARATQLPPFVDRVSYQVDIVVRNACETIRKEWEIQYFTPDRCVDERVRTDPFGRLTLNLPPKPYLFRVVGVDNPDPTTIPVVEYLKVRPRSLNLQALHDSLGVRSPDTTLNVEFFFHVTPEIAITNLSGFACDDPSFPVVIDQGSSYTYNIEVGERFSGFPEPCEVSEGYLLIRNNAARNIVTRIDFDQDLGPNGRFPAYSFVAGEPSPVAPFLKFMFVEYHTDADGFLGQLVVPFIVQGVAPIPGNDVFVNPLSRDDELLLPLFVLRDPPGDGSFSTIDSGRTFTASYSLSEQNTFSGGIEASLAVKVFGVGLDLELGLSGGDGSGSSTSFEITAETKREFSTSATSEVDNATNTDWLTGDAADVLVGAGFALQYGLGREVFVTDSCTAVARTVITTGAEIKTTWVYTMDQIRNLIREYDDKIEDTRNGLVEITGLTQDQTEDFFTVRKLNWEQMEHYHSLTTLPHYALCDPTNFNDLAEPWKSAAESWRRQGFCELIGAYSSVSGREIFTLFPDSTWQWNTDLLNRYNAIKDIVRSVSVEAPDFKGPLNYDEKYLNKYAIDQGYDQFFGPDAKNITFSGGTSFTESRSVSYAESDGYTQYSFFDLKLAAGKTWAAEAEIDIGTFVGFGGGVITTSNLKPFSNKGSLKGFFQYKFEREFNSNTTNGVSQSVSYTLSDDDPGDQYSVTIVQGVEPTHTPFFALTGGRTSCPNEPGAIDRDAPFVALIDAQGNGYSNVQYNLNPGETARFPIQLSNLNPFGEGRWYTVYIVENSNVKGATVKLNGRTISTNSTEDFFIPANGSVYGDVSIDAGPFYNDAQLTIGMFPRCDAYIVATQELEVYWRTPCTNVSIVEPSDGWVINSDTAKMTIKLKDYDPYNDPLKRIEIVYRRLGDQTYTWDTLGSLSKLTLIDYFERFTTVYPTPTYPFVWDISGLNLPDGEYEVMAIANCATGGLVESNKVKGTIARNVFSLFGTPEPADGLLSLGDEVSVAFNKQVDCPLAYNEAQYMFHAGSPTGPTINAALACFGNKLIFQLDSLHLHEGQMVYATLFDVRDVNGNLQRDTVQWSFEISNNPVYWSPRSVAVTVEKGETAQFTAMLRNTGTGNQAYNLSNSLSWLHPDALNGQVLPSGTPVTFTVDASNQQVGNYIDVAEADVVGFTVEALPITIRVIKPVPDWSVNAADYANSVNVIANISVDNGPLSTDESDVITAWIDGELRGVGKVEQEGAYYAAYLTVFGDDEDTTKFIDFRVWDASKGAEYQGHVDPSFGDITFESDNTIFGTTPNPVVIHIDSAIDSLQYIPLDKGWNWLSFNRVFDDMRVGNVLKSLTPTQNDMMMDFDGNSWDYDNGVWVTTSGVDTINNEAGYLLFLDKADTLRIAGEEAANAAIFLAQGWNLIGYQIPFVQPLNPASFAVISTSTFTDGDVYKSQNQFAVWSDADTVWQGNLAFLEPWKAYKVKSGSARVINYARSTGPATWNVNENAYEHAMRVLAVLNVDGFEFRDDASMVAAFVGNECRGVAALQYMPHLNRFIAPLFVYSSNPGEEVDFYFWDGLDDTVYTAAQKVIFSQDDIIGHLRTPIVLSPDDLSTGIDGSHDLVQATFALSPNPFKDQLLLTFYEPLAANYNVLMHNGIGELVFARSIQSVKGNNRVYLETDPNLASGMYFVTIRTDDGVISTFKMAKQ